METSESDDDSDSDGIKYAASASPDMFASQPVSHRDETDIGLSSDDDDTDSDSDSYLQAGVEFIGTTCKLSGDDVNSIERSSVSHLSSDGEQSPATSRTLLLPLLYDPVITTAYDAVDSHNLSSCLEGQGPYLLSADFLSASTKPAERPEGHCQRGDGSRVTVPKKDDGIGNGDQQIQPPFISSHRMCEPFPLRSAWRRRAQRHLCVGSTTTQYEDPELEEECVTLPIMLGSIPQEQHSDPVYSDINIYNYLESTTISRYKAFPAKAIELLRRTRDHVSQPAVDRVALSKCHVMLTHFAQQNPHLIGWNSLHNWLYSGGCLSSLDQLQCVVRPYGDSVAVSRLPPICDVTTLPVTSSRQFILPDLPRDGVVMQIDSTIDNTCQQRAYVAVRYLNQCQLYSLQCNDNNNNKTGDWVTAELCDRSSVAKQNAGDVSVASSMMCAVLSGENRWRYAQSDGRVFVRDVATGASLNATQIPRFGETNSKCWYGLHRTDSDHVTAAASPGSFYMLDDRAPSCVRLFELSRCQHLCGADDRIHALLGARQSGPGLFSLIATDRHVSALDLRAPSVPALRARLIIPQSPCYLAAASWRPNCELVVVGSSADSHVQCVALDWLGDGASADWLQSDEATPTPCQVGVACLLECATGVVCAQQRPAFGDGITLARSRLTPVGVACREESTSSGKLIQVMSANWYGDVFGHVLTQRRSDSGDLFASSEPEVTPQFELAIERIGDEWNRAIAKQRESTAANQALVCRAQSAFPSQLNALLTLPDEDEADEPVQIPVAPPQSRPRSACNSTIDSDTVTSMLSEWETDSDDSGQSQSGMSVEDELRFISQRIAGSRRRRRKRTLSSRRRRPTQPPVSLDANTTDAAFDSGAVWPSPTHSRTEHWLETSGGAGGGRESEHRMTTSTPRRKILPTGSSTPVAPLAFGQERKYELDSSKQQSLGYSQFNISLFDD